MGLFRFLTMGVLALATLPAIASDRGLPFIEEEVDEIAVYTYAGSDNWHVTFWRDRKLVASRYVSDEMQWGMSEDGKFTLLFDDYWTATRNITASRLSRYNFPADPFSHEAHLEWWAMARRVVEFKQP